MLAVNLLILAVLLLLSGIFSSSETALFSLSQIKVRNLVKEKKPGSFSLKYLKEKSEKTLITILIFNNLVNITASSFATILAVDLFGSKGVGIAIGVITFLLLLFGEITPKSLALKSNIRISLFISPILKFLVILITPITFFFQIITKPFTSKSEKQQISEEELRQIVSLGKEEGVINYRTSKMLSNVLDFKENKAADIMTPAEAVIVIDSEMPLSKAVRKMTKYGYSKYPIFDDKKDEIIGVIFSEEIIKYLGKRNLNVKVRTLSKQVLFVPETTKIENILDSFQKTIHDMAIVVNEYGTFIGIITLHDILEDLVGDIFDRRDRKSIYIKRISNSRAIIDARASLDEVNDVLHLGLRDSHFNTLAGLIQHKLGKIPQKGDEVKLKRVKIRIVEATPHKIKKMLIEHK